MPSSSFPSAAVAVLPQAPGAATADAQSGAPAREVRSFIVLLALLQGGLLYLAELGIEHGWWPFSLLGGRVCWYSLVLSVPTVMALSVLRLDDRRFWLQAAGVAVVFLALAAWASWRATGAPGLSAAAVLGPFGWTAAVGLFVALPWLQCRLSHGRWQAPYAELVEHAWQNALTLLLALAFVGLCWGVLMLWAALFDLLKIRFFSELFGEKPFAYLATGAMAGLGVLIGRTQRRPVQVGRQILFAVFKGLLPLLAFIALLFVLALPFAGLEPLWQTRSAATLLVGLIALMVLFVNAVHQDGSGARPYPALLRRVVEGGLLVLPVFAALALYALWLRIAQYGWTPDRFWAALIAAVASAYALGYAVAVFGSRAAWLAPLAVVNRVLSWGVVGLALLVNSPLLDPLRVAAASQAQRLQAAEGGAESLTRDLETLRFDLGRAGYEAAQGLRAAPAFTGDAQRLAELERVLALAQRWPERRSAAEKAASALKTTAALRAHLSLAQGALAPAEDWLQAVLDGRIDALDCVQPDSRCVLLTPDLDGDGAAEHLLCDLGRRYGVQCALASREQERWTRAGTLWWHGREAEVRAALEAGELAVRRQRWPDLEVAGARAEVQGAP